MRSIINSVKYHLSDQEMIVDGISWMGTWEQDIVEAEASACRGRVLEIGFGMGIAHQVLHDNPDVTEIISVEMDQHVLDYYKKCDCKVIVTTWEKLDIDEKFDWIFFDAVNVLDEIGGIPGVVPLLKFLKNTGTMSIYDNENAIGFFHRKHYDELAEGTK